MNRESGRLQRRLSRAATAASMEQGPSVPVAAARTPRSKGEGLELSRRILQHARWERTRGRYLSAAREVTQLLERRRACACTGAQSEERRWPRYNTSTPRAKVEGDLCSRTFRSRSWQQTGHG
eukprot:4138905-Pleurochrysis_carterae.AAC.2